MPTNKENMILVIVTFLLFILLCSSASTSIVFAKPVKKGPIECNNSADNLKITCCQTQTSSNGQTATYCTTCDNTAPPSNCGPRFIKQENPPPSVGPAQPLSTPPPPSNATTPPPVSPSPTKQQTQTTTTCPDGSAPDANGQCPTQNLQSLTNSNNGGSNGNSNSNNNVPSQQQNDKASNLLGHAGELTGTKKGKR
jgi:hypothetical protein